MPVLIHGEATDPAVDIFDREAVFMEQSLLPLLKRHAGLKVVVEHVTTAETVDIVRAHASRTAGTITPHHLVINRTSLFQGGLRPHLYCLPVAKRERHRLALRKAVTSGDACFFIGTDTAPHRRTAKEAECCSAGVFGGATALQTYVQVFDEEGALDRFEAFASINGARFYGLEPNPRHDYAGAAGAACDGGGGRGRYRSRGVPGRRDAAMVDREGVCHERSKYQARDRRRSRSAVVRGRRHPCQPAAAFHSGGGLGKSGLCRCPCHPWRSRTTSGGDATRLSICHHDVAAGADRRGRGRRDRRHPLCRMARRTNSM